MIHLTAVTRIMIEDLLHDVLRDVTVETGREQCSNPAE